MALTARQINVILQQARANGLSTAEVEGLRDVLLQRAVQPDAELKLRVAIQQLPPEQRELAEQFIAESSAITVGIMARGAAALNEISDEEWNAIMGEGDDAG